MVLRRPRKIFLASAAIALGSVGAAQSSTSSSGKSTKEKEEEESLGKKSEEQEKSTTSHHGSSKGKKSCLTYERMPEDKKHWNRHVRLHNTNCNTLLWC